MLKTPLALIANPDTERALELGKADLADDLWKVIVHNDDVTPMDFVIAVLVRIFKRPLIIAEAIMLEAHHNGQAIVMALPRAEGEKRIHQAHFAARLEGYPLTFTLEQ